MHNTGKVIGFLVAGISCLRRFKTGEQKQIISVDLSLDCANDFSTSDGNQRNELVHTAESFRVAVFFRGSVPDFTDGLGRYASRGLEG